MRSYLKPQPKTLLTVVSLGLLFTGTFSSDQMSKTWAKESVLTDHRGHIPLVNRRPYFRAAFTFVRNPGAAWGLLATSKPSFRKPFFFVISSLAMAFLITLLLRAANYQKVLLSGLTLVLAGAAGNFADRIRYGFVIDFIDLHLGSYRWPTFNIADIAVSIGAGLLLIDAIFYSDPHKNSTDASSPP